MPTNATASRQRTRTRWFVILAVVFVGFVANGCTVPLVRTQSVGQWEFEREPAAIDQTLMIGVHGGGCWADKQSAGTVKVDETRETVVITAHVRRPVGIAFACAAVGRIFPTSVELAAPVGDRVLIDAATEERR